MTNRPKKRPETRKVNRRNSEHVITTVSIPVEVYAAFKAFAEAENRTRRQQIRHLVEVYVAQKQEAA